MIGFPFDSHVTYEEDGTPVYDRAVTSAPLRKLIKSLFTSGVLPNPSTNMQVSADTGMNVIVHPGFAVCDGCLKLEEVSRTLAVQASNASYDRIDTVVLRLNDNDSERICDFYIKEGVPATSPVRAELTRSESVWELGLADLFIAKNSTAVSNQRITDTRYEIERCGIISSISEFDTTTLYQQVQADLEEFQNISEAEFAEWYDNIKGQLSEDAAGNLQNQIDTVVYSISGLTDIVEGHTDDISSAQSVAETAKNTADSASKKAVSAQSVADEALIASSAANTAAQSAQTSIAGLAKYMTFITDMQNKPTILEWAKNCNGFMLGMMVTPYAPADGPQMKVTSVKEWVILVLGQPGGKTRQSVIAIGYGGGVAAVLKRNIWSGNWQSDWVTIA